MSRPQSPTERYQAGVRDGRWQDDAVQRAVLPELDRIQRAVLAPRDEGWLSRLRRHRPEPVQGLYLWGKVGRGKTFLTELLIQSLPANLVERIHFHPFMRGVHERLRALGDVRDPLPRIAEELANKARVLCLDEFQVIDIGDAMLLGGLLQALVDCGVCLVTTSNTAPDDLYKDGLQRVRFEPAIRLLKTCCVVHHMASPNDWRLRELEQLPRWLVPAGPHADQKLAAAMRALVPEGLHDGGELVVNDRPIAVRQHGDRAAWFDFAALCEGPRAASDYLELTRRFNSMLVSGVPQFMPAQESAARRFVHLVDAMYEARTRVLMSAMTPIVEMYDGERLRTEFARTESRLIEMQSLDYAGPAGVLA